MDDSSAVWLQELIISNKRSQLDRIDRAAIELERLGWDVQFSRSFPNGCPSKLQVKLSRIIVLGEHEGKE